MEILGVRIDNLTEEEILQKMEDFLEDGQQHYIVLPYSEFIVRADKDERFRRLINQADLSICDGRGLFFAMRFLGYSPKEQVAGVKLVKNIAEKYQKIFLFGGRKEVVKKTADVLGPNIIGAIDGYQKNEKVIKEIDKVQPKIILVGLGSPKQEEWISRNLKKMPSVRLAVGVGGAFDFISGRIRRAPCFLQKAGMEWLWRLILEPWRVGRVFNAVVKFPFLVIKARFNLGRRF
jgi:N-acetylglucosaminyldiphosphoundecaprenol N-acetyl-beta-D-mannosaminyltransferase